MSTWLEQRKPIARRRWDFFIDLWGRRPHVSEVSGEKLLPFPGMDGTVYPMTAWAEQIARLDPLQTTPTPPGGGKIVRTRSGSVDKGTRQGDPLRCLWPCLPSCPFPSAASLASYAISGDHLRYVPVY
jgi:hypothetical protein